ncbi:MAG TPA: (4Fe-4S)-binding protein, partial [Spirochaetaceae bacterium]|nr:(4Fe-4S)-binding protein [Spirochaetaceae bacterium]
MITITIASGKGGAGKTSITAALAAWLKTTAVAADCDVDAANTAIALGATIRTTDDYWSGDGYSIDPARCADCGRCAEVCRFGAIQRLTGQLHIDEALCERCAACQDVCPAGAVVAAPKRGGSLSVSATDCGSILVHAKLIPGEDTSGKLVRAVRLRAEAVATALPGARYILVDAPPGIGCPVIAALSGADLAVVVVEAGQSGIRDARRLYELLAGMKRRTVCVVNKAGLAPQMDRLARDLAAEFGSPVVASLPFDKRFRR